MTRVPRHVLVVAGLLLSFAACGGDDSGGTGTTGTDTNTTGGDTTGGGNNAAPVASIDRPQDGAIVAAGAPVTFTGSATDDRDRPADLAVTWTTDRRTEPLFTGPPNSLGGITFDVGDLAVGDHVITMAVVDSGGLVGRDSVTITVNASPSAPEVAVTPAAPTTADALKATITKDATDPNRASTALTYSYAWFVDGAPATGITGDTVPAARTTRGEVWEVRVRANDGLADGAEGKATATIGNAPPVCTAASLLPSSADTAADFTCACTASTDADGDDVTDTCAFFDGDTALDTGGACTLPAAMTEKGMAIRCEVAANDGEDTGPAVSSGAVDVTNAPPTAPTATLGPEPADAATEITCAVGLASTDADGDSLQTEVTWLVGGHANAGVTAATVVAGTLASASGASARRGDSVTCELRAFDGAARSAAGTSNAVVLGNAAPLVDSVIVSLAPGSARLDETATLKCLAGTAEDADGDALTLTYRWYVNDVEVTGVTGANLTGADFARGDSISCAIVADDGQGGVVTSETSKTLVVIGNALPSLAAATLTPTSVGQNGQLTCTPQGWADPDGDALEVAYGWFVTVGATQTPIVGASGGTLTPDTLAPGTQVVCVVTPKNGADTGAPVTSNVATVTAPEATAPVMQVSAPDGAHGDVRCDFVTPAQHFAGSVSYTYFWTVNGGAEAQAGAILTSASDCDLVTCRAVATDGATTLSSAAASLLLPVGDDCDTGDVCKPPVCEEAGGCGFLLASDLPCDDGDACTTDDTCDVGFCVAQGFADEGASCEDGLFCTGADTCDGAGSCRPGADPCARPASSCLVGSCDEIGGTCLSGPKDADAPCSDGNGCTLGDHCSGAGVCLPGSDVDCGSESDECNAGTCRSLGPNDHVCDLSPRSAGVACTNPDFCIVGSQCDGEGGCVGGTARDCQAEAGDQCNSATCNTLQAKCVRTPRPQNSTCDDGDDCTLTDRCSNGACVGAENACVAEQLSYVDGGGRRPSVLSMGFGRYVTLWAKNTTDPDVFWRLSDARGGRESDEVEVNSPGRPLEWTTGLATRPGGDFIVGYWYGVTTVNTTYTGACASPQAKTASASVSARAYDYIGTLYNTSVAQQALLTAELKVYSCESVNNRMDVTAGRMYPVPGAAGFGFVISAEATRTGNLVEMMSLSVPDRNVLLYPATALVGVGAPVVLQDDAGEDRVATGLPLVVKLANDGSGDFFAAWVAFGGDHAVVRRYSANGARRHDGANLLSLAAPAGGSLVGVRLAPRHDGGLYVALDAQTATTGRDALLRRFDAAGAAADGGVATQLHAASAGDQRLGEIDVFSDDGLAATWDDSLGDTSGYGVKARLFNADGAPRGPETLVNTLIAGTQELPTLAVLDTDEWVVAFVDDQETVYTRRYLANGKSAVGALDWRLNSTTTGNQKNVAAARTADGRVLAVYETPVAGQSKAKIVGRFVTVAGARPTIAPEVTLNAGSDGLLSWPDVAAGAASIAAVWQATGVDGNGEGVVARMFDQAGTPVSGDFVVNQWATGTQSVPSVAVVPDGRAVVAWQGPKPGGGGGTYAIYRVFAADGTPLTDEALVDEDLTNYRAPQVVAVGSDVVIAYTDYNNTGAIYLRRLSLEGDVLASWHSTSGRRGVVAALSGDGSVLTSCFERTVGTGAYSVGCSAHDPATLAQIGDDSAVTDRWPGARMVTEIGRSLRMAPLEGGRTVVGWQMDSFYVDGAGVKATALDEVGALSGPDIVATRQLLGEQSHPEVVWLGGTNAVVFWEDDSRDGSNTGVYFRVLTEL